MPLVPRDTTPKVALSSTSESARLHAPKFTPVFPGEAGGAGSDVADLSASDEATPSCRLPELIVIVNPRTPSRTYGSANPRFTYSVNGLLKGDAVSVSIETAANKLSAVGTYSVKATASVKSKEKYNLIIYPTDLIVTQAPLTVKAEPASASRLYGAANPSFTNAVDGLVNGDTVTVTDSIAATNASSVGPYPVTPSVSGAALGNYDLKAVDGTLHVRPAVLRVFPAGEGVTYGQTPATPAAYSLTGFVDGDTASVVSGAPVLSTTVTSSTPAGIYRITSQVGTLTATNYTFFPEGAPLEVYKAPITVTANNVTMTQGSAVPTLTYTLAGFVNGDTASVVSGAPELLTAVTSSSPPGTYAIAVRIGTLSAANYGFIPEFNGGTVTVTP